MFKHIWNFAKHSVEEEVAERLDDMGMNRQIENSNKWSKYVRTNAIVTIIFWIIGIVFTVLLIWTLFFT